MSSNTEINTNFKADTGKSMYIKNQNIVKREIHKEYYLIDIKQNYLSDKCYLYVLNTMGNYIWDLLDQYNSPMQISRVILGTVVGSINITDIYKDVTDFLNLLEKENFLEYIDEGN